MAKRPASELLEDVASPDSPPPSSKKVRVGTAPGSKQSNHVSPAAAAPAAPERDHDVHGRSQEASVGSQEYHDAQENGAAEHEAGLDEDHDDDDNGESAFVAPTRQSAPTEGYNDLYLDTIDRGVLDFDFEKLCSVSLSNMNVYACLVCGKYFQGRGPKSHAYFHALDVGHHVYVNMATKRVYVLPEGYEVKSKSLDDIKFVVDPHLSKDEVARLDKDAKEAWDLAGKRYQPGSPDPVTLPDRC